MSNLVFQGTTIPLIEIDGTQYITLSDVAAILYRKGGCQSDTPFDGAAEVNIRKLYSRHADEFTAAMTCTIKRSTAGGEQSVRVFSLRGCHLLGLFARTDVAKEFRRWVLDVLEQEQALSRELWPRLQTAISDLMAERCAASVYGRGLYRWKTIKTDKEETVKRLVNEAQPRLFID